MMVPPSPHLRRRLTKTRIMWEVVGALLPAALFGAAYFGWADTIPQIAAAVAGAVGAQAVAEKLRRRRVSIMDGAPWVTGLILGMSLPPGLSVWLALLGGVLATGLIKAVLTTSTGRNILNPAMGARVLIISEFLVPMTSFDTLSQATPLADGGRTPSYLDLFLGLRGGSIGETSALLLLAGGLYLLWRGIIRWQLPLAYLTATVGVSLLLGRDPLVDLMGGATMLTAFFIVTDPTTAPATFWGRLIFGGATAAIATFIRVTTLFPTGEALAVVLLNFATPVLDRILPTRVYGTGASTKEAA